MIQWTFKTTLFSIVALSCCLSVQANDITQEYIQKYKPIAINEMNRVGIPASIKMAQAILESSSGQSTLARQSNNHFGIKCGRNWTGGEVFREDDDYENGLLVRSCFRAYSDPFESFMAHSDFLANPKSNRYKSLFNLDPYDYKGWAKGLRKAGYATDPKYPSKLINLIEKYQLYLLDQGIDLPGEPLADNTHTTTQDNNNTTVQLKKEEHGQAKSTKVYANRGRRSTPSVEFHIVKNGEQIVDIASRYGMSAQELAMRNRIPTGSQPKPGEQLAVNSYIHFGSKPAIISEDITKDTQYLWEETVSIGSE